MSSRLVYKYDNLRKKSIFIELFPWVGGGTSTAIYPNVYLSRAVYKSIYSETPDPYKESTVLHEEEHIRRIKKLGPAKWYWLYFTSNDFRINEELAATEPQFAFLKRRGLAFNFERKAKVMSGHLYFWAISREDVYRRLTKMWDDISV